MNIEEYMEKMKIIQDKILNFIVNEDNDEENYENLIKIINDQQVNRNQHDLKVFLYLIIKIANNHHRNCNFFRKIEQILHEVKVEIKKNFSNKEIFKIFNPSKRILLFIIEEQIITVDQTIYEEMIEDKYKTAKYLEYFSPEIKPFLEHQVKQKENEKINKEDDSKEEEEDYVINLYERIQKILKEDSKLFNEKRKKGENDGYLYQLIRTDSIEDFIIYVNKEDYSLNTYVEESIYETNSFLLKQDKTTLIEYSAFFGSIQIFKYLYKNNVKLTPSLWIYAVHGENEEIIHILEENNVGCKKIISIQGKDNEEEDEEEEEEEEESFNEYDDNDISYDGFLKEAIKCHHNYMVNFIENNYMKGKEWEKNIDSYCFQYFNFQCFPKEIINDKSFFYACKYDYYTFVQLLLNTKKININSKIIFTLNIL